jgi:8-amino-3,8-dideoxy-alpha-D-manno-octulosonate transaminase
MPGFELFGDLERKEVNDVLDSGVLMRYGFDKVRKYNKSKELEELLQERMQVKHAQVVSSGTAALAVALMAAHINPGDHVILPTFTFVASFEAILSVGAVPILVDVDDTLGLNADAVEKAITSKTKAVMAVHMCGSMTDLTPLKKLCLKHNLILIEDACQAIGGTWKKKPLGSIGDVGCFSFDYVKTITCGEGGAMITNNKKYYTKAEQFSDHGHDHLGVDRGADKHPIIGYNYRISELNAAVGVAQIKRLDDFLAIQKKHYSILEKVLKSVPQVTFRRVPKGGVQNYSFMNFFLSTKALTKKVHAAFAIQGIDSTFYWFDNNWHYHKKWDHLKLLKGLNNYATAQYDGLPNYAESDFSASDAIMSRTISCLVKLSWTEVQVQERAQKMVEIIKAAL